MAHFDQGPYQSACRKALRDEETIPRTPGLRPQRGPGLSFIDDITLLATLSNGESRTFVLGLGSGVKQDQTHRPDDQHERDHDRSKHTAEHSNSIDIQSPNRLRTRPKRDFQWPDAGPTENDWTGQEDIFAFDEEHHASQDSLLHGTGAQFCQETLQSPPPGRNAPATPQKDSGSLPDWSSPGLRMQESEPPSLDALVARLAGDRTGRGAIKDSCRRSTKA